MTVTVGDLNSIKNQIPFHYKYLELCESSHPKEPKKSVTDIFSNSDHKYSNYNVTINQFDQCKISCVKSFTETDINIFKWLVQRRYFINYFLDSLPAGLNITSKEKNRTFLTYNQGIPIGIIRNDSVYLYNHYNLHVHLNEKNGKYQIVGFNIEPFSILQEGDEDCRTDINYYDREMQPLKLGTIAYTYNVFFYKSNITFSSRWDYYLGSKKEIHWIGLINANILIFIITFLVLFILSRAIKKDIEIYNRKVLADEIIDEFGWKQVCNDVFRKPKNLMLLSALIGTGIELFLMLLHSLLFSVLGFMSPERRGGLINLMICVFCIMGIVSGYVSSYIYKINGGRDWLKCSLLTTILFPGISMIVLFIVRVTFSLEQSSEGFTISEFAVLVVLWICISTPLVLIGSFFGIRKKSIKFPCKVNVVPSIIGQKPWYLKLKYISWFTGLIPFATVFIEFIYIMATLWKHQVYFVASFVSCAVFFIVLSSAEISIIFIYLNLCKGDYNWWWKSFFVSASPALYIAGYSIYYFFYLDITRFSAGVVYLCLMGLVTCVVGLVCGACGVLLTFGFLYFIYSKIKID